MPSQISIGYRRWVNLLHVLLSIVAMCMLERRAQSIMYAFVSAGMMVLVGRGTMRRNAANAARRFAGTPGVPDARKAMKTI
ncbi:MAG: hypothetical protein BGO89_06290 [Candidatus Kapaibacterium thiocyanatum]|uniref:Uncharacterized protein n=1 Tax=Candidatus Kapaibacterium thiocyanatum TaxID=1895771 RepID=A0A1M3KYY1_9BACT|nr:MAG: hypothetical protein BGO89_06290 ['Candidatus Kapabacteria' thiocyanatum]